jgi:TonB dependent receptor
VENIPLNGRSFQTLIMLTPGVVVTQTAFDDQGQFSVNGQRADANYFTVDGVSANFGVTGYFPLVQAGGGALPALSASGGTNGLVSVDAMQEFRVQTSSFEPEYGRTPGGQISIVTRSGSNQFHGTAFEYFRNSVLDANDWFSNRDHLSKPEERQNDFGGVFSGPILKDKTFFFFSYEGLRLRQPATQETVVPDTASRQQAPTTMQPYLNAYPVPNGPELGQGLAQFNGSYSNPSSLDAYSIRVDHAVNSKLNLFGRYNYSPSDFAQRGPYITTERVLSTSQSGSVSIQTFTLGLNQVVTPQISNEIRANYSNDRVATKYVADNFGGAVPLPDSLVFPSGYSSANGSLGFNINGAGVYTQGKNATDEQRQINLIDNLSWSRRNHQLKFGGDYRWLSPFTSPYAYRQQEQFSGVTCPSAPPCPGYAVSGTSVYAATFSWQSSTLLSQNFSAYGQDTWKLTPRLTLTYGLRWDINTPLKGKTRANDAFAVIGLNNPATMTLAPRGTPLYDTTYGNVEPRVGLAYQFGGPANSQTVLRAGFGIFYDLGYGSVGGSFSYWPFTVLKVIPGATLPLSAADAAPPPLTTSPPASTIDVVDPRLKLPRTYEWNVALERSLGSSQVISFTYVGAVGRDLLRVTNLVNPNPDFGFVGVTDNSATSDYHALQVKFQRRLSHGLQALGSYTFSHSIDIASTDAFANYLNAPAFVVNPNVDRGNSDFDIRDSFTAGVTYTLPSLQANKFARATMGGWSVDAFVLARSTPPVNIISSFVVAAGTALYPRPNVVVGVPQVLYGSQYPGGKAFNNTIIAGACPGGSNQVGAWCPAPTGQQGDFGRNVLRGFGATQADVAFQRQFRLTEQWNLRFRAEFFNIFNHPNFGPPNNSLSSPLFGHSTQTLASSLGSGGANGGFNPLYQIGGPRSIQLALKLAF